MRTRAASFAVLSSLLWAWPGLSLAQELTGPAQKTFTTDADFQPGTFNATRAGAPNPDQLRIDTGANVPPYLWVANASAGVVTKVDTRTGLQVARYDSVLTVNWDGSVPAVRPPRDSCNYPAAVAVDAQGNTFVLNRGNCSGTSASITRYAGSLAACVDRNGNGRIDTSFDASGNGAIDLGDPAEFFGQSDECILWTKNFAAAGDPGRALVVDADQHLWAAGFSSSKLYRMNGQTGGVLQVIDLQAETGVASSIQSLAIGPSGYLYTSDNSTQRLIRKIDPRATSGSRVVDTVTSPVPTFGLVVDSTGKAWLGADSDSASGVVRADFTAHTAQLVGGGGGCTGRTHGVAVDAAGDIWAACWASGRLLRVGSDGAYKATWFVGSRPEGVAVAADGKIWTINSGADSLALVNPAVASTVQWYTPGGASFSYGDMTGYHHQRFTARQGTWGAVHDGGAAGATWGMVTWNQEPQGATPVGASITVGVRAADTAGALASQPFAQVVNGQAFAGIRGRYVEVLATLRSVNYSADPVLSDLTLYSGNRAPVASCQDQSVCAAGPACTAEASINHGSTDPDGDSLSLSQLPAGPYAIGQQPVSLTVTDGFDSDSCTASVRVRDCEPPSITCAPPVQAECTGNESAYVSAGGAEATDACSAVDVSGPGLASYPLGSTPVTYTAKDVAGNTAACTTQVQVRDTLPPSITCPAATTVECVAGAASNNGVGTATAVDVCSPVAVQGPGPASFPVGRVSLTWSASDTSGNTASCSTPFTVVDTQAPSLALNGANPMPLECMRDGYSEPGATAVDSCSGNISGAVTIERGTIDSARLGTYPVTYRAADSGGNVATAVRQVVVQDTLAPDLTLNGASSVRLECKVDVYSEPGAIAQDLCSGNLADALSISGEVNTNATGAYPVRYRVQDRNGLVTEKVRDVRVVDTRPPVITLDGSSTPVMECSRDGLLALGATATDLCAGDITNRITISGTDRIVATGTYPITYNVTDPSGNAATSVTRSVTVRDTQAPVVTIRGEANMTLECGVDAYTELGATAYDACQGDMTVNTYGSGANAAAVGTYSIQYGVWDASGNTTMALRTVKVVDRLPPTLALVGESVVQHECASGPYTDAGATASDACYGNLTRSVTMTGSVNAWTRGSYTLTYNVQDSTLLKATPLTRTVQVVDTQAPTIEYRDITVSPADQALRTFSLADCVTASDACDGYALANNGIIRSIYSDEPEDAPGSSDGSTLADIVITSPSTFQVRAERQSDGDGRVYGVAFDLKDQAGNVRSGVCRIRVPANSLGVAADSGPGAGYTVVAPPPAPLASRTAP
ncbi:immunoglobulin-like domain-containing protein [Hyalangium minutum]|uniref:HYR domain-containing protein n=1 Tax=Hyalangium minutum TaxID=394096 RepID=A0A085WJG3_9BACT|nr:immunoglobulin-like domain-containing protein [Hyalangium minutum]KFE67826.1 hypothetical protein DB31_8309 [Hyalangium minutum]